MELSKLTTEKRNVNTMNIDQLSTLEMVKVINKEDQKVAIAVEKVLPQIAEAIDQMSIRFKQGGRLIYCGAGTSGRLGALDAIELTPTYSVPPEKAFGLMAGGKEAMFVAVEGAEDSKELAYEDLKKCQFSSQDILIAIAASGRTPYTIGAIEYANQVGALSVSVTCNDQSEMNKIAQIGIAPIVGPEVITGSTRMKAGTAQKLVLNTISTGIMIQTGKVYQNLMVNVQPTNKKLIERSLKIIQEATGVTEEKAQTFFNSADQKVDVAIVMTLTGLDKEESVEELKKVNGKISEILKNFGVL